MRGLAFLPKGYRLARDPLQRRVALVSERRRRRRRPLEWKGSHLDVTFSPDGRFLVTSMQENALHGWRFSDSRNMRMTGYPAKTRSLSWSHDGHWLATSGADACSRLAVPGQGRPDGQGAARMRRAPARVTQVAFHPSALVVAIGYEDGLILLVRLADAAEILVRPSGRRRGQRARLGRDRRTAAVWS